MEKYLKMSGFFVGSVSINADGQICDDKYFRGSTDIAENYYEPICHAINSHDELVENMQHYKQDAEQWEARATKEASRAQDLLAEVERLTEFCESFSKFCEDVSEFMNHSNCGNSYWKSYQDYKKTKGL